MKVYTLLNKQNNPVKPFQVYGNHGSFLFKGVANNIPWHIAKCDMKDYWEDREGITWVVLKGETK